MSGDELLVLIVSFILGAIFWTRWIIALLGVESAPGKGSIRYLMVAAPALAMAGTFYLLTHWASHDVVDSPGYIFFYLAFGAAWTALGIKALGVLGLPMRDDVCERGNAASAWALSGGILGLGAAYAGANIGDGPGWWCVAFAGGLATLGLLAGYAILDSVAGAGRSVTVDRDPASGMRLGAYLAAAGFLLGRAAAGDWTSADQTVVEFRSAWPVLPLTAAALFFERTSRPTPERPRGSLILHALIPALVYAAMAAAGFQAVGPIPDHTP